MGEGERKSISPERRPWLWAAPFFLLALVIAVGGISPGRAWPVAALLLVGVLIVVVPPSSWKEFFDTVEKAQLGPSGLALERQARKAAEEAPERDTNEGIPIEEQTTEEATDLLELRMRLEWKLTYVAKHLLAERGSPTFLTIGSLRFDQYLTKEEAATAAGILVPQEEVLRKMSKEEREEFLADAGAFVDGVRASIFWGQVRRRLRGRDAPEDADLFRGPLPSTWRRDDILAGPPGKEHRVATTFALDENSELVGRVLDRLKREATDAPEAPRQIVVVPDVSDVKERDASGSSPRVVRLANLRKALEEA